MKIILIGRGEIFYKVFLHLYEKKYLSLVILDNKNLCQDKVNSKNILIKCADKYIVFKKV